MSQPEVGQTKYVGEVKNRVGGTFDAELNFPSNGVGIDSGSGYFLNLLKWIKCSQECKHC